MNLPKRSYLFTLSERLVGVGVGIIIGSFLTYYLTFERKLTVNVDTYILLAGIGVIVVGAIVQIVAHSKHGTK